jgi:hypothetical protein
MYSQYPFVSGLFERCISNRVITALIIGLQLYGGTLVCGGIQLATAFPRNPQLFFFILVKCTGARAYLKSYYKKVNL